MGLDDEDIEDLISSLSVNENLEKLELDENLLNSFTMLQFAEAIGKNVALKHLSLENNDLGRKEDYDGAGDFLDALKTNSTLQYLNLASTRLDNQHLEKLLSLLEVNKNLVMVDVSNNPGLDYKLLRKIQEILKENRRNFEEERKLEWRERKTMKEQDQVLREINNINEKNKFLLEEIKVKEEEKQAWRQKLIEEEIEKGRIEDFRRSKKLEKEMMMRALKKKRKGKKKKK